MAIVFDDLVIDRVVNGVFRDKNANVLGGLNQIQNFQITTSSDPKDKTDAQGTLIKRFFTTKSVEMSAENALFSLSLLGLQTGEGKTVASANNKIVLPMIKKYAKATEISLPTGIVPIEGTLSVTGLKSSGVPDASLVYTSAVSEGEGVYVYNSASNKITLPTDCTDCVQVQFNYESDNGVKVLQTADKFPKECELTLSVLVCDACDKETIRQAYIVFPAFQMAPDFDITLDTESVHPFSGIAAVDYCAADKSLFYIAMSEDDIDE
jgi:hypothetical protein